MDWAGVFLYAASGTLTLLGLNWGSTRDWRSPQTIVMTVVSGVLGLCFFIAFVAWERMLERHENAALPVPKFFARTEAMIPLSVFRSYDVVATFLAAYCSGLLMFGCIYFLSVYYIVVANFSPTASSSQVSVFLPGIGRSFNLSGMSFRRC